MYKYFKRILDPVIAMVGIVILIPLFLIICVCIKLESRGPVLFIQQRSGLNGKVFNIYKFRSMQQHTPNLATDQLEHPSTYITLVGKFMRNTSLDELPQLINLIKGEMSLVGPRPALYNQYELIEQRRKVGIDQLVPGITGYAQIMGRDFISDEQKVVYDKIYLDNVSFVFDIKIICKTFLKVVTAKDVKR